MGQFFSIIEKETVIDDQRRHVKKIALRRLCINDSHGIVKHDAICSGILQLPLSVQDGYRIPAGDWVRIMDNIHGDSRPFFRILRDISIHIRKAHLVYILMSVRRISVHSRKSFPRFQVEDR
jgi:hypothetical protein